jgi:hypothetical protein
MYTTSEACNASQSNLQLRRSPGGVLEVEDFNQPAIFPEAVVNAHRRVEELADARAIGHRHTDARKVLQ